MCKYGLVIVTLDAPLLARVGFGLYAGNTVVTGESALNDLSVKVSGREQWSEGAENEACPRIEYRKHDLLKRPRIRLLRSTCAIFLLRSKTELLKDLRWLMPR